GGTEAELRGMRIRKPIDEERGQSAKTATAAVILAPLRNFLKAHARTQGADLDIVMLPRLIEVESFLEGYFDHLDGFAISPRMMENAGLMEIIRGLFQASEIQPTIFLSYQDVSRLPEKARSATLAHEVGHAFGLGHTGDPNNLMSIHRRPDCMPI